MMSVEIFTIGHSPIAPHGAVIEDLTGDWRHLDERIKGPSNEIEAIARQDIGCERLMSVPGVGPIISSAMVAATGAGDSLLQGPGLRRMAGPRFEADVDRRPHNPAQNIQAWQSLSGPTDLDRSMSA
jgi:hypothetical protein